MDLISTIGESVSLGAAGVILWGDASYASSNVRLHPSVAACILTTQHHTRADNDTPEAERINSCSFLFFPVYGVT